MWPKAQQPSKRHLWLGCVGEGRTAIWVNEEDEPDSDALSRNFPALIEGENYHITSPRTVTYNCLAWALGIDWAWYSQEPQVAGYLWFPGVEREWTLATIRQIFAKHGYKYETDDRGYDPFWQKVAFYCDSTGVPVHFSRQQETGLWTSKMARLNDITHFNLDCFEDPEVYGPVQLIVMREREHPDPTPPQSR